MPMTLTDRVPTLYFHLKFAIASALMIVT